MAVLVGCTLEEAREICRVEGLTLVVRETRPPREFTGDQLRVVRARQGEKAVEVLVASFRTAQDPTP